MSYLYLHVPFCASICYYCDFKRSIYNEDIVNSWLKEINSECLHKVNIHSLKTIYIGGGTPSCLNEEQLDALLTILDIFRKDVIEYTIESNIESLNKKKVEIMIRHGVNRISLGIQSLNDNLLKDMNRKHTRQDAVHMVNLLHEWGIKNISIDLIYGFENQTIEIWENDLKEILCIPYINHLSLYSLTIEENSVFYKQQRKTCANELEALMYEKAIQILKDHDFIQYEVANFAKKGYESLHNQAYWKYEDFYGIGVGASGKSGNVRYCNSGSILDYINGIEHIEREVLNKEELMFENIMMSLRMRQGISIDEFDKRYQISFLEHYKTAVEDGINNQELIIEDDRIKTSEKGMFFLHDILIRFMKY